MDSQKSKFPPISKTASHLSDSGVVHPATSFRVNSLLRLNEHSPTSLSRELNTPRLNNIHHHLWLAGLPKAARPLHRQKLLGRNILITEDPDEHLVWFEDKIFIKPLPEFLLDWDTWNISLCSNQELYKSACGMLLSYAWLVRHKSDLEIAKDSGLLLKDIEWAHWVDFINVFLANINCEALSDVNQRYRYGELRLSRLNTICRLFPSTYSLSNMIRGYQTRSTWYQAFFGRHFKWMLAVFATLSIILSALQVGLATTKLQDNAAFQIVSYRFTATSLIAVAAGLVVVLAVWLILFIYHLLAAWQINRVVKHRKYSSMV
ncbi:hypothetical protein P154DRAFT_525353 [Amniculicola lignicola CBS 123094]|uniref:Uncharacterized protein n=1 Tax=Amniculicola lignicola CBS 123094 TaxID=1392246 RepID=A0A6A5W633_9PLEO|nr:hypothetical protein P154DRAFT_525353 [Amniculicola lignicola CBS 123094]